MQRSRADTANTEQCRRVFDKLDRQTNVLQRCQAEPHVLDLCATPGGFNATVLELNRGAKICRITLLTEMGGHLMLLPYGSNGSRVNIKFIDITEFRAESELKMTSTNLNGLSIERPFHDLRLELVMCDGQVLRTHASYRVQAREIFEAKRLTCSKSLWAYTAFEMTEPSLCFFMKPSHRALYFCSTNFAVFSTSNCSSHEKSHASRFFLYDCQKM